MDHNTVTRVGNFVHKFETTIETMNPTFSSTVVKDLIQTKFKVLDLKQVDKQTFGNVISILPALCSELHADVAGELLRDLVFDHDLDNDELGCYSTFTMREYIKRHHDTNDGDLSWSNASIGDIKIAWAWDGDGTLKFTFQDGRVLINTDCKKTSGWRWQDVNDEPVSNYEKANLGFREDKAKLQHKYEQKAKDILD